VKYNLLERAPERSGLLQRCADLNVTLVAHSPLSQGLLTGAAPALCHASMAFPVRI
jgi:aryl-alcohol dehydrogenase-like predicted oxidoreductase